MLIKPAPRSRGWKKPSFCLHSPAGEQEEKEPCWHPFSPFWGTMSHHSSQRAGHVPFHVAQRRMELRKSTKINVHMAATLRAGRGSPNNPECLRKHSLQCFAVSVDTPELLRENPKCSSSPGTLAASLPALICETTSPLHQSLTEHKGIHQKTTIPEQWIPGTLQGGVWGLGSRISLIQGPVIKVKRAHISSLYMQFMSWYIILRGTLTLSWMNTEQINPWRIPVNCTNTRIRH